MVITNLSDTKVLTEEGVRRLWEAIEKKFIDTTEIANLLTILQEKINNLEFTDDTIEIYGGSASEVMNDL